MKITEIKAYLQSNNIDFLFLSHSDPTTFYLLQQNLTGGHLVITSKETILYHTALDTPNINSTITLKKLEQNWYESLILNSTIPNNIISNNNLSNNNLPNNNHPDHNFSNTPKTIALNFNHITLAQSEFLKKIFPSAEWNNITSFLTELRIQKTAEELQQIKHACQITSDAFSALTTFLNTSTPTSEQHIANFLNTFIQEHNCELSFPTIIASGPNAGTPHHKPTNTLHHGFCVIDFGAKYQGYCADMTRTIFFGTPTIDEQNLYHLLLECQIACINHIPNAKTYGDLTSHAKEKLGMHHEKCTHALGHGIGIEIHEAPCFKENSSILPHTTFTIEPGIYEQYNYGIRIEDTLYWDGTTSQVLTTAPKELLHFP